MSSINHSDALRDLILAQDPTPEQIDAIFALESEYLLKAAPGSGKTWTSSRRFVWRVHNWNACGGLALLSFTNTAIREFQAATALVGKREMLSDPHFFGTFDSFVERFIIAPFSHLICDKSKRPRLHIGPFPSHRKIHNLHVNLEKADGSPIRVAAWELFPAYENDQLIFRTPYEKVVPAKVGYKIIKSLLELGYYTHQHRNFWACNLLSKIPRLSQIIAKRFPEIIVDEAQDSGFWSLRILDHLKKAGTKITLIGDPDQCIYEFSLASAGSLSKLKTEWNLVEKPLNKSFRCNDAIASSVKQIGGNSAFVGRGAARNEFEKAYLVSDSSETFARGIAVFREKLRQAGINEINSAILCRGHDQMARLRGKVQYLALKGKTKRMAEAAFLRDNKHDYKAAYDTTEAVLRELLDAPELWNLLDEDPESSAALSIRLAIWRFVRNSEGLPSISLSANAWIRALKDGVTKLFKEIGVQEPPEMSKQFKRNGLKEGQFELPLLDGVPTFPSIRFETVHKVKGESIDGVLVVGSKKFYDGLARDVIGGIDSEERRVGYVAMTRARHVLVVAVPDKHFVKYGDFWKTRGFEMA